MLCGDSGKYNFSFATEYCLISHKSSYREKTSPKNISDFFIYFYEICLHVLSFHRVKFSRCSFVNCTPVLTTSFLLRSK